MSRLAPFVDAAVSIDRTAWPNLFISYYTYGQAIGLGLDLSLRDDRRQDDARRLHAALWANFGLPGQKAPGMVATTYTIDGSEGRAGAGLGRPRFRQRLLRASSSQGHDVADYARLLARMGLVMRKRAAGKSWLGTATLQARSGGAARRAWCRWTRRSTRPASPRTIRSWRSPAWT